MTARATPSDEYARKLMLLVGNAFEDEVVIAFQQTDQGFQRIPRKPNGDGGLDGLSHGYTVAYCCYGPEQVSEPGLTDAKRRLGLVNKIVAKFKGDLMRLLELEFDKATIVQRGNPILEGLLGQPPRTKLKSIKLIVSWFEDNRIAGGIQAALKELVTRSACRFVEPTVDVVVWGPTDVANNIQITQVTLTRVEHPGLLAALRDAAAASQTHEPQHQDAFNDKFNDLIQRNTRQQQRVEKLRTTFKQAWSKSLLLDERLARDLPAIHARFEELRPLAVMDAQLASAQEGADPIAIIESSRERLRVRVAELVPGGLPEHVKDELAYAETGRLIGDCDLDWRGS